MKYGGGGATFRFISNHLLEVQAYGEFSVTPRLGEGFLVILQQMKLFLGELPACEFYSG
jgi:hypothetical protein